MNENDRFLRMALRTNASFSALCALLSLFAAQPIAVVMGIPDAVWLQALGVQLLAFAGFLVWLATRPRIPSAIAWGVVAADAAWVVGTLPLVAVDLLTTSGIWIALCVADAVALCAILQTVGVRRMQRASRA